MHVLLQREAERCAHLGERPVRDVQEFEAPREAVAESSLDEERRRTEEYDMQRALRARVGVPLCFHDVGPRRELLHFVEDEDRTGTARAW
jgi:hypothetical protein